MTCQIATLNEGVPRWEPIGIADAFSEVLAQQKKEANQFNQGAVLKGGSHSDDDRTCGDVDRYQVHAGYPK